MKTLELQDLLAIPRITVRAVLRSAHDSRMLLTVFPGPGSAEFRDPDGSRYFLLESAQAVAHRLSAVAWDDAAHDLAKALRGLPYVRTTVDDLPIDSVRESQRLNSPYLHAIWDTLRERAGLPLVPSERIRIDRRKLAAAVFYYDPNSVVQGVFLEGMNPFASLVRAVSGFIEAHDVRFGASDNAAECTAKQALATFTVDVALLRSYGLGAPAARLLIALALWKIRTFLERRSGVRGACDLILAGDTLRITHPRGMELPSLGELESTLATQREACNAAGLFASPPITHVVF